MKLGIEQEFVFRDRDGQYLDAENSSYEQFANIVDEFPLFPGDAEVFECKSLEKAPKRCYVEGFEQHDAAGQVLRTLPKGIEIRTLPHSSIEAVVREFQASYSTVMKQADERGLFPVLTSRHPFRRSFSSESANSAVEQDLRTKQEHIIARNSMIHHGLHVNVSFEEAPLDLLADMAQKLNYYLPAMIPYSFSSPFANGREFDGLCARNYYRAYKRRMTDVHQRNGGVLEFRAFDACGNTALLTSVLTLFSGVMLDDSLSGRAPDHDPERLQLSSVKGFADPSIRDQGREVLQAARTALGGAAEPLLLLEAMLESGDSYAARMRQRYLETGDIMGCISDQYEF